CRPSPLRTLGKNAWPKEPPPSCVSRRKVDMTDPDLDELARELAEFDVLEKEGGRGPREERVIAGFEDIQRFVEKHGHPPRHGEDRDIFERLYAVRLDRLRSVEECRTLLAPTDHQGLLGGASTATPPPDVIGV